jgi:tetratricopeptide (TPR) repeat protein
MSRQSPGANIVDETSSPGDRMQAWMSRHAVQGALVALALPLSGVAFAQDACKINDGSPYQLAGARNYVTMAANAKYPTEIPKHLANAIKVLTDDPAKIKNEPGRHFLLLRTYAQILQGNDAKYVVKRGEIGLTENPEGLHNILMAIDSSATALLASMPACKDRVEPYRARWVTEVFNKAVQSLQDEKVDSAVYYSHQTLLVSPRDPRPWNVLVTVYQTRNQMDSARYAMNKVLELAGDDSVYKRVAQQHRYNLAILELNEADAEEGAAKEASIKAARALLDTYLKIEPGDPRATQALGRALTISGDTAAVAALYKDMIANPERFTDVQLFEGASNAAASKRDEDAAKLFAAGLAKNPYHRLGLINAANVYFTLRDAEKMGPIVTRLLEIEPNSQTVRHVYAGYWQIRQRAETDAAKKKAYADSTLAALKVRDELSPRVEITRSSRDGNNFVLDGTVTNGSDKEQSWTIKFELLDEKGAVVGTREVPVGPIGAGSGAPFSVRVEAPKAVAFRYAQLK